MTDKDRRKSCRAEFEFPNYYRTQIARTSAVDLISHIAHESKQRSNSPLPAGRWKQQNHRC